MEAANSHIRPRPPAISKPGELVLQNGRQAGARRSLGSPTTILGRNQSCDIRLNVDGVDSMHCLLVHGPDGVRLRDLNSIHGTYVNGDRADNVVLQTGDLLKIGPYQFRLDLIAASAPEQEETTEESRDALRIQAAAVAAQQIALEEEEGRLQQRRNDLQHQEEQLAAHLAEKQHQVQLWSDYTKTERETFGTEKIEHERQMATQEQELLHAKQELGQEQRKIVLERQRINKLRQRLRQRWQRQWAVEKEHHRELAQKLEAAAQKLDERQAALEAREITHAQELLRFNTERELGTRQLRDARESLEKNQGDWQVRRSHEVKALKTKQRALADMQLDLQDAGQLLVRDKSNWDHQQDTLQKELHGLNNRIVHQRMRIGEQEEEITRLDAILRERRLQLGQVPILATQAVESEAIECEVEVLADPPAESETWRHRLGHVEHLANELADQRLHLIEQYNRLAEIQDVWQRQRDQAAAELERLAKRLLDEEQTLSERDRQVRTGEEQLQNRQQEIGNAQQEMQVGRAQLRAREDSFLQEHEKQLLVLRQRESLLQAHLVDLTALRQRWNRRRQQEVEEQRTARTLLERQQKDTTQQRGELFEKVQQLEEGKRILAEKSLALEQYRQEVFFRANDPEAQRRVERLRRRWLTLNAAMIRAAKSEQDAVRTELASLEARGAELLQQMDRSTQNENALAEKQSLLDEREVVLKARQLHLDQELKRIEEQQTPELRLEDEVEIIASAMFEDAGDTAIDQAA